MNKIPVNARNPTLFIPLIPSTSISTLDVDPHGSQKCFRALWSAVAERLAARKTSGHGSGVTRRACFRYGVRASARLHSNIITPVTSSPPEGGTPYVMHAYGARKKSGLLPTPWIRRAGQPGRAFRRIQNFLSISSALAHSPAIRKCQMISAVLVRANVQANEN